MTGLTYLASRHILRRWGRSLVLIICLAVAIALPLTSRVLVARFDRSLHERAATTPMVVGAKGSRFDLVFGAIYFRAAELGTTTMGRYNALSRERGIKAIPVNARFTVRTTTPIVATTFEYLDRRGLTVTQGRRAAFIGETVLGSAAAGRLRVGVGDSVFSDQRRAYDITSAQSIKMTVVGVLAPSGSPDDEAAFVDLQTAWVLEGITHGHTKAEDVATPSLVIGQSDEHIALSAAVKEYQEITPQNAANFHLHGDESDLPLTAVLVWPADDKTRTIVGERVNQSPGDQAVMPTRVIDDLMAFVVRLQAVFDALAGVLMLSTAVMIGLIGVLSYRIREDELRTLGEIGASRHAVAWLFGLEAAVLLGAATVLGLGVMAATLAAVSAFVPFV